MEAKYLKNERGSIREYYDISFSFAANVLLIMKSKLGKNSV